MSPKNACYYRLNQVVLTKKMLIKNPKYVLHSLYVLETHLNHPKMLNILEFIRCSYKESAYKIFQIYPSSTLFP